RATGAIRRRPRRSSARTATSSPATSPPWPRTGASPSSAAPRTSSSPAASTSIPRRSRRSSTRFRASTSRPWSACRIPTSARASSPSSHRCRARSRRARPTSSPRSPSGLPSSSCPSACSWPGSCPATPWARCRRTRSPPSTAPPSRAERAQSALTRRQHYRGVMSERRDCTRAENARGSRIFAFANSGMTSGGPSAAQRLELFLGHRGQVHRLAAAAGAGLVGVGEHELGRELVGHVVHLGAQQVHDGLGVDQHAGAVVLHHLVEALLLAGPVERVLHAGAAALLDADAQAGAAGALGRQDGPDALGRPVGELHYLRPGSLRAHALVLPMQLWRNPESNIG